MPGGIKKFKLHKYFINISFHELRCKTIKAPLIPEIPKINTENNLPITEFKFEEYMELQPNENWYQDF
jgi:hypothetical protein